MTFDLRIHHITFVLEAQSNVHFGAQVGAQIRGALWHALDKAVCIAPQERQHPDHARLCPMCFLLELQAQSPRGQNPPRPFAVRPPLAVRAEADRVFAVGETFEVGMTLMGKASALFPYLVQGMRLVGRTGVGYGRGRFEISGIHCHNPLTETTETLLQNGIVRVPTLTVTHKDIVQQADALPDGHIHLRFLTPTTLKQHKTILHQPEFTPLIARLLERCQAMLFHYADDPSTAAPETWQPLYQGLIQAAADIQRSLDNTRWVDVRSGSRRSNYYHDMGGFVGEVRFEGDVSPFHEWLLWGQSLQVGKNTVKGSGWYEITPE